MVFHFSEYFFLILKKEIDEIFKRKKVKRVYLKDYKVFIFFDNNLALKISLHPQIYYFYPVSLIKIDGKELPFLKGFYYDCSEIIKGERIFIINFLKKNPLGEIEKRKAVIDFTKIKRDFLILKEDKVIYSFRKEKNFVLSFKDKINIFESNFSQELMKYIKEKIPFLYEIIPSEDEKGFYFLKENYLENYTGPFYVDKELKLHLYEDEGFNKFGKLYLALSFIYENIERKIEEEKREKKLKKLKEKEEKKKKIIERELKVKPDYYRIKGEAILLNLKTIGDKRGKLKLFHPEKGEVEVEIKENETPEERAQKYFERYKKLKVKREKIKEVIKKEKKTEKIREFVSPSGYKVLVSKSKEYANTLTFKIANPWDYFFHVRNYPGAHVILRRNKNQKIDERDIIFAAKIAKNFSKAKNENKVEVIYTLRKYIKPLKGEKGKVKITKENVIIV